MKNLMIVAALFFSCSYAKAQPGGGDEQKAMMEYMMPGDMHKWMASIAGEWKTSNTMWMQPGAPPMTSEGTCKNEMMFDGRYMQTTHTSSIMGMPFTGIGMMGYDNALKMFVSTWIDNMGTGIMYGKGSYDAENKKIEIKGMMVDPMQKKEIAYREVFTIKDDKNMMMEMFADMNGKEHKCMELKYVKK